MMCPRKETMNLNFVENLVGLRVYLTDANVRMDYAKPTHKLNRCKYRISIRGPYIWNEFLSNTEKEIELTSSFKSTIKINYSL